MRHVCLWLLLILATDAASGARFGYDIPGDGSFTQCCTSEIQLGTVSASTQGALTGELTAEQSALALLLGADPVFLTFSGGGTYWEDPVGGGIDETGTERPALQLVLGPLGRVPEGTPTLARTGQFFALTITNAGPAILNDLTFYLLEDPNSFSGVFVPRGDGLTFGLVAAQLAPEEEWVLLGPISTTAGNVNPVDVAGREEEKPDTYGDLLRFQNMNLTPGASATVNFWITDSNSVLRFMHNGRDARESFALAVIPGGEALVVPEPGTAGILAGSLLAFVAWAARRRARSSA
jgi:hypothetical protein